MSDQAEATPEERRALFRIVRGEPDDAEVAALTAVLAAFSGAAATDTDERATRGAWSDPAARLRTPLTPGPDAWRASARPR